MVFAHASKTNTMFYSFCSTGESEAGDDPCLDQYFNNDNVGTLQTIDSGAVVSSGLSLLRHMPPVQEYRTMAAGLLALPRFLRMWG